MPPKIRRFFCVNNAFYVTYAYISIPKSSLTPLKLLLQYAKNDIIFRSEASECCSIKMLLFYKEIIMKKVLLLFVSILLIAAFIASVYASDTYSIPELYMNVNAPEGWVVISRNADYNSEAKRIFAVDDIYLSNYLEAKSIYIDFLKPDMSSEITIYMTQDDSSKELISLNALSDKKLKDYIDKSNNSLFGNIITGQAVTDRSEYEIYNNSQAVFIKSYAKTVLDSEQISVLQYITVQNGQAIVISAFGNDMNIPTELESTCKAMVDSITFTQLQKGNRFAGTILSGNNLIYLSVGVFLGLIIILFTRKKKTE